MAAFFFDSSGIVKRYMIEAGSNWVGGLVDPSSGNLIYLAEITGVEVISAVVRRSRGAANSNGAISRIVADFRRDLASEYLLAEINTGLLDRAMNLAETYGLRGYDAVQLAAAMEVHSQFRLLGEPLTLISADLELNAAAHAEGLAVDDPNAHP